MDKSLKRHCPEFLLPGIVAFPRALILVTMVTVLALLSFLAACCIESPVSKSTVWLWHANCAAALSKVNFFNICLKGVMTWAKVTSFLFRF